MFESDFVDAFSRVPWYVVPAVYLPLISLWLYQSFAAGVGWLGMGAQLAAGWLAWTLLEYWAHRTVFHWVPSTSWGERFHFVLHGVHHTWHSDRLRLVMPPAASLLAGGVIFGTLYAVAAVGAPWVDPTWVWAFFAGVMLGYMVYDLTHFGLHHMRPRGRVWKRLRAHHMNHHFNQPDRKFGVSTTLWDHVFGTW